MNPLTYQEKSRMAELCCVSPRSDEQEAELIALMDRDVLYRIVYQAGQLVGYREASAKHLQVLEEVM